MIRFTDLLANGLRNRGFSVETVFPRRILVAKNGGPDNAVWKWLGYVDKWILFPIWLRRSVRTWRRKFGDGIRYHICDHSNAPYLAHLPKNLTVVTCHDVLAIRGALGYPEAYCAASRTGVYLQRWILKHLSSANRIAAVSQLTLQHLCEIVGTKAPQPGWKVLHNAFNAEFKRIETGEAQKILRQQGVSISQPFLLHVGSNLPRKNRRMLLLMTQQGDDSWPGHVCFAGEAADARLTDEASELGILDRIHSVSKPDHQTLCALYSLAHALIFPSFSEGFGWPLIEAQACGTPVIASNLAPLPEVSGGAAIHADPHNALSFGSALRTLDAPAVRESLIANGYKNIGRFGLTKMIDGYLALHDLNGDGMTRVTT